MDDQNRPRDVREMTSLNIEELDVQELERRLEMAAVGGVAADTWVCIGNCGDCEDCGGNYCSEDGIGGCDTDCRTLF